MSGDVVLLADQSLPILYLDKAIGVVGDWEGSVLVSAWLNSSSPWLVGCDFKPFFYDKGEHKTLKTVKVQQNSMKLCEVYHNMFFNVLSHLGLLLLLLGLSLNCRFKFVTTKRNMQQLHAYLHTFNL